MNRRIPARLAAAGIVLICAGTFPKLASAADDSPLIWSPSKTGANAYKLRFGVRRTGRWNTSAGAEVSMDATRSGKINPPGAPVRLWGTASRESGRGAPARSSRVSVDYNALRGTGNFGAGTARSWILTPTLDAEVHRSIALQCNAYENRCNEPRLTQSAKLVSRASRTSLTVQSQVSSGGLSGVSRIGVEQNFGNLRLGAAVAEPLLEPRSVFDIRYSLKW
ncbi:hypothetical protein C7U60_07350 [Mesorhizobium plurifarium]|uniref:hypothetical protein n=1 Tax=Sinorhizobium arboris TaxID=76745 RepID=UPI0003F8DC9B|nr:hypothetical protein [Sinorhizobium arboris]PST24966.1 hypothetical protein C7U60_07630 [Mesorhizobium plurifarium]PST25291.1 hypothetical protein C7U60_07350 [Mesorhizobium plurifarium]